MNTEIIKQLDSTILMLNVHPDNKQHSEFEDRINALISLRESLQKEHKWQSLDSQKPICYEKGDWDGLKSDIFLCRFKDKDPNDVFIAVAYEGQIDGSKFFGIYDHSGCLIADNDKLEWKELFY